MKSVTLLRRYCQGLVIDGLKNIIHKYWFVILSSIPPYIYVAIIYPCWYCYSSAASFTTPNCMA
jgi:hypothetical protein